MKQISRVLGIIYSALVPNAKGAERALADGTRELDVVVSASNGHSPEPTGRTEDSGPPAVALLKASRELAGAARSPSARCDPGY
jgi:hydroxymethylglutaryl-CoA lyase